MHCGFMPTSHSFGICPTDGITRYAKRKPSVGMSQTLQSYIEEAEKAIKDMISKKWALGFKDRGHGHGDFGIVVDEESGGMVVECPNRELAEHIISIHNETCLIEPKKIPIPSICSCGCGRPSEYCHEGQKSLQGMWKRNRKSRC
jgi:hypothetical protein